jgi:hypothetical protein
LPTTQPQAKRGVTRSTAGPDAGPQHANARLRGARRSLRPSPRALQEARRHRRVRLRHGRRRRARRLRPLPRAAPRAHEPGGRPRAAPRGKAHPVDGPHGPRQRGRPSIPGEVGARALLARARQDSVRLAIVAAIAHLAPEGDVATAVALEAIVEADQKATRSYAGDEVLKIARALRSRVP